MMPVSATRFYKNVNVRIHCRYDWEENLQFVDRPDNSNFSDAFAPFTRAESYASTVNEIVEARCRW